MSIVGSTASRRIAMAKKQTCETCSFWRGGASSYNGDCGNPRMLHRLTPFDFTCQGYAYQASQETMATVWDAVAKALQPIWSKPKQP
jgi:hypothetical protein